MKIKTNNILNSCYLIMFLLAGNYVFAAEGKEVKISIPAEQAHALSKAAFGVNALFNFNPIAYTNRDLAKKYGKLGSQLIRFPGGTPANFYDFKTGYHDVPTKAQSEKHQKQMTGVNKSTRQTKGDIGGYNTDHFIQFQKKTKTDFSLVLNICTKDAAYTKEWLKKFKKKNIDVKYVEVGNEIYFGIYKNFIKSPEDYITKAKKHVKAVKEVYPNAKIGAVISSHSFTDDTFVDVVQKNTRTDRNHTWDKIVAKADFYDAVIIHMYGSPGIPNSTTAENIPSYEVIYKNCMSHQDFQYTRTVDYLKKTFPSKKVWVTEYHVGGFGGALRQYRLRHSPLGVLYACNFFMELAVTPEVDVATYHSFAQMVRLKTDGKRGRVSSKYDKDKLIATANYDGYQMFNDAVENSDSIVRNTITGGVNYNATGKYKGSFPELNSVSFISKNEAWVFVTNKFDRSYTLTQLDVGGKVIKSIRAVKSMTPDKNLKDEKVLIKKGKSKFPVKLPPHSLTMIKVKVP